ncbi:46 kDa FK506-binding nuclear protein-like [Coccinella septempunctata]|uniref:46 kDa FK506-binding nuclear protein-like n=1 Tax=Coccinella septempunctata TaxID=41139 RepID=UPI001D085C4F|nr:46 kDa FK506-binding nuclear protein-like [Coccinella septempunctata]
MFWGLIMEPQKRYSQVVKKAFHISMASLDISNSDDQPAQVLCGYEGKNYLLCTLQKPEKLQCNLDLYFEEGRSVSFASNGKSLIHLTGYLTKDGFEGDSDEEEAQEFEVQAKKKSRGRDGPGKEPSSKKLKLDYLLEDCDEEDSDDSDFNIEEVMEEQVSGEGSDEDEEIGDILDEGLEEEDESMGEDEDEEEEGEEEDSDDDDDDEEDLEDAADEEVKVEEEKVVQNGLSKKSKKKNKKEEEQSTPTIKNKQSKEKPHQLTPGPKTKKSNAEDKKGNEKEEKKTKENQSSVPKRKTLSHGIIIEDLRPGQGNTATNGKFIHVYYEGRLQSNNKLFDKTLNGPGFGFRLGKGEVIKAWDIGVNGMKVGGKRRIICPPQVAYGSKGSPPVIPPNATLVFEVELKKIK